MSLTNYVQQSSGDPQPTCTGHMALLFNSTSHERHGVSNYQRLLEKYIVYDACGLRSPSFESSSVLCYTCLHLFHTGIGNARNAKNTWVGWCVSSWWPWFLSVNSIYDFIHIVYCRCILSSWNKLFLKEIYIPRVNVTLTVCRIVRY